MNLHSRRPGVVLAHPHHDGARGVLAAEIVVEGQLGNLPGRENCDGLDAVGDGGPAWGSGWKSSTHSRTVAVVVSDSTGCGRSTYGATSSARPSAWTAESDGGADWS